MTRNEELQQTILLAEDARQVLANGAIGKALDALADDYFQAFLVASNDEERLNSQADARALVRLREAIEALQSAGAFASDELKNGTHEETTL